MATTKRARDGQGDGGYGCDQFVETPPEYLICGVCKNVLRNPQLTECCGGNVCRPCVEKVLELGGSCPLPECGEPNVKVSFNRKCRNDIDECMVYCSGKSNGCQWVDKLEKLDRHLEVCGFYEETCLYGCGRSIQRRQMHVHQDVCEHFKIRCRCGTMYERQNQSRHVKVCQYTLVKCPFNIVGCDGEFMNIEMRTHLNTCLAEHYRLVAALNHSVEAKFAEMKPQALQEYESEMTRLNGKTHCLKESILKAHKKIELLQAALHKGEGELEELERVQASAKTDFGTQVGASSADVQALSQTFGRVQFESKVKLYGAPLPRPAVICSRPPEAPPTMYALVPPLTFTIPDFADKKAHDAVVYTPPFLTHPQGYKLSLQIHCNGDKRGRGKFLSIFANLLKGEYDEYLSWPFSGSFTLEIRNLSKNAHNYVKMITFDDKTDTQLQTRSRVTGDEYFAPNCVGYWNFMPLSVLLGGSAFFSDFMYIQNKCLKIDISSVQLF